MLHSSRTLRSRVLQLEQEIMTTRQLSSLSATPTSAMMMQQRGASLSVGGTSGGGGVTAGGPGNSSSGGGDGVAIKQLEEKILRLQEDLTSAYRLQSENSHTFLRLKEQAEKDEKALLRKEAELAEKTRSLITAQTALQSEKEASIQRHKHLEQTVELLRAEVQSARNQVKMQETKIAELNRENGAILASLLQLKEQQSLELNELNKTKTELRQANALAQAAAERQAQSAEKAIQPQQMDLSDLSTIIDHVAWESNFNVAIPTERKRSIRAHRGPAQCVRYNTKGTLFASAGHDGIVKGQRIDLSALLCARQRTTLNIMSSLCVALVQLFVCALCV